MTTTFHQYKCSKCPKGIVAVSIDEEPIYFNIRVMSCSYCMHQFGLKEVNKLEKIDPKDKQLDLFTNILTGPEGQQ